MNRRIENWRFSTDSIHFNAFQHFLFVLLLSSFYLCVCLLGYLFARGKNKIFFFVYVKKLIKICGAVKLFERFQPSIYFTYVHKILWSLTFAYSPYFSWCRRASIDKIVFILTFNISYFHKLLYLPAQCNGEENVFSHFLFSA